MLVWLTEGLDDPWLPALAGGEDYQLLLAIPPGMLRTAKMTANAAGSLLFDIGRLTQGEGVTIMDEQGQERQAPAGWQHR